MKKLANSTAINISKQLSDSLNELLALHQLDGMQLSKSSGIPFSSINRLRNEHTNPTLSTLIPIARYFSVSVSQLIGEEDLNNKSLTIPLLNWEQTITWPEEYKEIQSWVSSEIKYSSNVFALILDEKHYPQFCSGSILIFDPDLIPQQDNLVIAYKEGHTKPHLKRIILEEDIIYLQSLISETSLTAMTSDQKILGILVESKKYYR